ncbi:MAG: PspA/IM30 family protein [Anaerolineales bacterium]|nr:PspA/IM30 family protein [Anaerolineales bacterium]
MASLIDKVQTLISANLHAMVDKALEANSVAVMDEYIRQAEDNLEKLEDTVVTVGGNVKTLKRKWQHYQSEAEKLDQSIDTLLLQQKKDLASAAQARLNSTRRIADDYEAQYQDQQKQYEQLLAARRKLEAKLTTIRQEREHLQALLELAKSKEVAVQTIKSLDDLAGVGDADIARIGESIRARLDRATAQGEMYAGRLDTQMDEVLEQSEIDIQLEERMRRLGIEAG